MKVRANVFLKIITMYIKMSTLIIVTPRSGKRMIFIFFMLLYIVNVIVIYSTLSEFSLNNKMLREIYNLYDKRKLIHTANGAIKTVSSHCFLKGWTDLECHQQSEQCINDNENICIFIMYDPTALFLELHPKEMTKI